MQALFHKAYVLDSIDTREDDRYVRPLTVLSIFRPVAFLVLDV